MSIAIFGFQALWSPYFFAVLVLVLAAYFMITIKYRHRFKSTEPLTKKQGVYFTISIITLYLIKGSPVDLMGHLMFYAHMIQMAILYLVVPQLMIIGVPSWIWRAILSNKGIKAAFTLFTKPLVALIAFNGMFSFYHIPLIFDFIKTDMWIHGLYTGVLFLMAIFMWWPLVNQLSEFESLSGLKKVGYIFADGILLTPACALIIFAKDPMYATFSDPAAWAQALALCVPSGTLAVLELSGPEMFSSMSLLHDQQLGGVIMKIIQEIVYGYMLSIIFFNWYRKEQDENEKKNHPQLSPQTAD